MEFIRSLSESKLLRSTSLYQKYSGRQIADLVYLHMIALRILAAEPMTQQFARDYAQRSARYIGFAKWYQNATDLHLLLHALVDEDVKLKMPDSSQAFRETLYFDDRAIRLWLKGIGTGHAPESRTRTLFMRVDGQFQIKDSSEKAIRRLVQDWPHNTINQKQLAMTRLLQILRVRARQSDLLPELEMLAKELKLELHNVSNQETGDIVHDEESHNGSKKKGSLLGRIAAGVAGALVGYHGVKAMSEGVEDDYGSWISPTGEYYPVAREGHEEEIYEIENISYGDAIHSGWIRVVNPSGKHWHIEAGSEITREGISTLRSIMDDGLGAFADLWEHDIKSYETKNAQQTIALLTAYRRKNMAEFEQLMVEDDGGGATTSADVAPVVRQFGEVRRRNKKNKKK